MALEDIAYTYREKLHDFHKDQEHASFSFNFESIEDVKEEFQRLGATVFVVNFNE